MEMSIAKLSTGMASMKIGTEISMKVMKMAMEQTEAVGEMISQLSAAASPDAGVGQVLDVSV